MNRRRMILHSEGDIDYISSGLVFRVDGKDAQNGIVKDLVQGYTFTAFNPQNISFANDAIVLDGNGCLYTDNADNVLPERNYYTVEACFSIDSLTNDSVIVTFGSQSGSAGASNKRPQLHIRCDNGKIGYKTANRYLSNFIAGENHTVSMNSSRGIDNGVLMETTDTSYVQSIGLKAIIGGVYIINYKPKFTGKIYSIRIYSRNLSEAEQRHNQMVDNIRFNLGLNL